MAVRDYKGAAPHTTLATSITNSATSFSVAAGGGTGYPTGSGGNFVVALDTGLSAEEKILCSARAGDVFTVATGGRGWDDTAAAAHNNGAGVDHVGTATDLREANAHVNNTTGDPHPQYLTPAEGDAAFAPLTARAALAYRSAALSIPNAVQTAIGLDAESVDTNAMHDLVSNNSRIVLNKTGMYQVTGQISYTGTSAAGRRQALIAFNGSFIAYQQATPLPGGNNTVLQVTVLTRSTVTTDYVELLAYQDSGAALALTPGAPETWLSATYLGA